MDDFLPATVYNYSTWPKGEPEYWALPAMGDALAWIYRKDWFARPEIQEAFKAEYGRDLGVPKSWDELMEIAKFFQGREIDGKTVYGAAIYTERGSEGITMGVTAALYSWGFQYQDPDQPYHMEGFVNSPDAVAGARVLQGPVQVLHAARAHRRLHDDQPRRLQVGPGGDADELVRLHARHRQGCRRRRRQVRLLRQSAGEGRGLDARRPGHLGRVLLRQAGPGARVHQVVRAARGPEEVVVAWRLLLPQGGARGPGLRRAPRRSPPTS